MSYKKKRINWIIDNFDLDEILEYACEYAERSNGYTNDKCDKELETILFPKIEKIIKAYKKEWYCSYNIAQNYVYLALERRWNQIETNPIENGACPNCLSLKISKYGKQKGKQRWLCRDCQKTFYK